MKFEIIGSGGCVSLPKPLCGCNVCVEAREKGRPFSRFGCSLYIEDLSMIIDTPEDITHAINSSQIQEIKRVMYSHMDPDHVLGLRVFEQLRLNWLDVFEGRECDDPIEVLALPNVMSDLGEIKSVFGPYLDYYEHVRNLITRKDITETQIGNIKINLIPIGRSTVFVFTENDKKVIYAPCDVKPFPQADVLKNADLLIIGDTFIGETLKNGYVLPADNRLRDELFSLEEIISIKEKLQINKVIITHIEEDWGKSYTDYLNLEKGLEGITFAYDGMKIVI